MSLGALGLSLLFGALVGVASGVVGVGGGVLMVPFLYLLFAFPDWSGIAVPPDAQAVVAHATSLFVIIPTAAGGLFAFQRARLVAWRATVPLAIGAVLAAALGARTAVALPPSLLKGAFGLLLLAAGTRLLWKGQGRTEPEGEEEGGRPLRLGLAWTLPSGLAVGFFSALMGVGGGIVAIPILIYLIGLDLPRVAATSIGVVVFAAPAGVLAYLVAGLGAPGLPPGTVGYVFLPAGLALIPGAVAGAVWGAALNQRMNTTALRWTFALLFLVLGARLALENGRRILG